MEEPIVDGSGQRVLNLDNDGAPIEARRFVTERTKPILLVECKWADAAIDKSLRYVKAKFPDPVAWQVSAIGTKDYQNAEGIRVSHALNLLETLI
jgi:hypothetical protein